MRYLGSEHLQEQCNARKVHLELHQLQSPTAWSVADSLDDKALKHCLLSAE